MKRNGLPMLLLLLFFIFPMTLRGQDPHDHDHHHHLNEIGVSVAMVQLAPEDDTAVGLHIHAMRKLGDNGIKKYFGFGIGTDLIFADHFHTNLMATIGIFPFKNLVLHVSPGILFVKEDGETETRASFHFEILYEFDLGIISLGPYLGFGTAGSDHHFAAGLHLAKGF